MRVSVKFENNLFIHYEADSIEENEKLDKSTYFNNISQQYISVWDHHFIKTLGLSEKRLFMPISLYKLTKYMYQINALQINILYSKKLLYLYSYQFF